MTASPARPLARLTSPGEIAATVPALCGFVPQDSVVLLSLRGPRRRLGLTVRLDLPPPALDADVAAALAGRLVEDGASAAAVLLYADAPRPETAAQVTAALEVRGVRVVEALHVAGGRWTSYLCSGPCCPPGGTPVPPVPSLVAAEHALSGRAVLPSREDLVRALAAPPPDPALLREARRTAPGPAQVQAALDEVAAGGTLSAATAAAVAVALHDVGVRDELVLRCAEEGDTVLALAHQVAARVGPPHDAPVSTVLAWAAYARGDGARANVALERALRADPSYALALLLQAALEAGVAPGSLILALRP